MTEQAPPQTSKEELIVFHKGSLNTLIAERNELLRLVQITENLIGVHAKELEGLGVKIQSEPPQNKK